MCDVLWIDPIERSKLGFNLLCFNLDSERLSGKLWKCIITDVFLIDSYPSA